VKSKPRIALIDYGMGNLQSVGKALEISGAEIVLADKPSKIKGCGGMVLPGVGSFYPAITTLKKTGLFEAVNEFVSLKKPFFGICLGFQLIFDRSTEEGSNKGFAMVKGEVKRFNFKKTSGKKKMNIPHMGWNTVKIQNNPWAKKMFMGVKDNSYFYFVHSYYPALVQKNDAAGITDYGVKFCSAIARESIWASQFHPEKSGETGLTLLRNFISEVRPVRE
jgi:imidazole glycerol-phosphate synthase subunit HisH